MLFSLLLILANKERKKTYICRKDSKQSTMSNDFKRIPYGISDFKQVWRESKYLVDKTMYFERMKREEIVER